jgi:hypothetical protein
MGVIVTPESMVMQVSIVVYVENKNESREKMAAILVHFI